jgi:hypothetical protein
VKLGRALVGGKRVPGKPRAELTLGLSWPQAGHEVVDSVVLLSDPLLRMPHITSTDDTLP